MADNINRSEASQSTLLPSFSVAGTSVNCHWHYFSQALHLIEIVLFCYESIKIEIMTFFPLNIKCIVINTYRSPYENLRYILLII